ncbi:AI-2E family transporter [Mycolicibacterium chitae]|uniref:Permease n=1 Tax=Mycolicibacterium chitae TaxID=1792 RepID=A0A448I1D4_MYCCI|nr:AI-2E family transporter [Mycolicibacterium chitae]MCV7105699.1 AI-2E family transporter [Mycolicibacterium chitae]BBZ03101.1 AI-2E family transporter [Mycolicibacterium chitae]VEG46308.1 permease [Mycolicibacterium chitae]
MLNEFTLTQKRVLAVLTVIALAFGAYFLRSYLVLIAMAAVLAYLFRPIYSRLRARYSVGLSATATLLAAIAIVAAPLSGIVFLAVVQIGQMVNGISHWMANTDLTELGKRLLDTANEILAKVPFMNIELTPESVQGTITRIGQNVGEMALGVARDSVGSIAMVITSAIIFLYVFLALLTNGEKVLALFRDLNPLGPDVSNIYLAKVGAMVTATVRGQFIIAVCQGVAAAISLYIAGLHDGFFMFVIFLSALSFIPLGAGIVTIPLGIGMALFGNVVGGIFVVVFHLVVVTNIDNVLRPFLVPKSAHLHPALMLLSVFAGLKMFGFVGIVLGPVLMIVIVTTISVYLAVYKGAPLDESDDDEDDEAERKEPFWKRWWPFGRTATATPAPATASADS